MDNYTDQEQAVELLQQLGLSEYEARSFVALTRMPQGTAKEISEVSDVPRTRVYDAVRVLESKGLVEIQHSNPQQFRSVPIEEATETLKSEYESRTETLQGVLKSIDPATMEEDSTTHEVWSLSSSAAITNRTQQLIDDAEEEVVFVIGDQTIINDDLIESLYRASQHTSTIVGVASEELRETLELRLPKTTLFVSELKWLQHMEDQTDSTVISRLLLADRESILVSTYGAESNAQSTELDEQAVFGHGFDNGFVTVVRRLLSAGLLPRDDPKTERPSDPDQRIGN